MSCHLIAWKPWPRRPSSAEHRSLRRTGPCPASSGTSRANRARFGSGFMAGIMPTTIALSALQPDAARACAACYGQSDSPMAQGMNWGIFSLLGTIVVVLGGIAAFFVYVARRSASAPPAPAAEPLLETMHRA